MLTVEFQKKALEQVFGPLAQEEAPNRRVMLSAKGYIRKGEEHAPLCVMEETEAAAVRALFKMVADEAFERPRIKFPPRIAETSNVYADTGEKIVYRKRDHQLIRK